MKLIFGCDTWIHDHGKNKTWTWHLRIASRRAILCTKWSWRPIAPPCLLLKWSPVLLNTDYMYSHSWSIDLPVYNLSFSSETASLSSRSFSACHYDIKSEDVRLNFHCAEFKHKTKPKMSTWCTEQTWVRFALGRCQNHQGHTNPGVKWTFTYAHVVDKHVNACVRGFFTLKKASLSAHKIYSQILRGMHRCKFLMASECLKKKTAPCSEGGLWFLRDPARQWCNSHLWFKTGRFQPSHASFSSSNTLTHKTSKTRMVHRCCGGCSR